MPDILPAKGKTEGLQPHGFIGDGARVGNQVRPAELVAVFLLDRPKQTARLVQVDVIWPGVDGCKSLVTGTGATAAIRDPIGTRRMPGHADHQTAVVTPVRWPPFLAICHQCMQVFLERIEIEFFNGFPIVEAFSHRIGFAIVLMQNVEVQGLGPPLHVRHAALRGAAVHHWTFVFRHGHPLIIDRGLFVTDLGRLACASIG